MGDYQMLNLLRQETINLTYEYFLPRVTSKGQSWKCESLSLEKLADIIKSIPALVPRKDLFQVVSTRTFLST